MAAEFFTPVVFSSICYYFLFFVRVCVCVYVRAAAAAAVKAELLSTPERDIHKATGPYCYINSSNSVIKIFGILIGQIKSYKKKVGFKRSLQEFMIPNSGFQR